jgi:hypothetical protein
MIVFAAFDHFVVEINMNNVVSFPQRTKVPQLRLALSFPVAAKWPAKIRT